jgi:hypothetical protein
MTIEQYITDIKNRNERVEKDKAWEVSKTRRFAISLITYLIAAYYMRALAVDEYYFHAFVPTGGYLLSTLALPTIKRIWMKKINH